MSFGMAEALGTRMNAASRSWKGARPFAFAAIQAGGRGKLIIIFFFVLHLRFLLLLLLLLLLLFIFHLVTHGLADVIPARESPSANVAAAPLGDGGARDAPLDVFA